MTLSSATPGAVSTRTGLARSVVEPSPSWLLLLAPTAHTVPSVFSQSVWMPPPETACTPTNGAPPASSTRVGKLRLVDVPSPSC
jgi:hypothetical protein